MITLETIKIFAEVAVIFGGLIAITSFVIGIRKQREISQFTFFAEYTKRYQEIVTNLPEDMNDVNVLEDEDTRRYLRVYFDLCSEEYFLYTKKQISEEVWDEWKDGIKTTFRKEAILEYWKERKTSYYDFSKYLVELLKEESDEHI